MSVGRGGPVHLPDEGHPPNNEGEPVPFLTHPHSLYIVIAKVATLVFYFSSQLYWK